MRIMPITDVIGKKFPKSPIKEKFIIETLAIVIMNFDRDDNDDYNEIVSTLLVWDLILKD